MPANAALGRYEKYEKTVILPCIIFGVPELTRPLTLKGAGIIISSCGSLILK